MIRTTIVDYDDQIRQEHEEVAVNDQRCDDILTVCYNYLGEILRACHLSSDKGAYISEAFDYIDEALRVSDEEEEDDNNG